MDEYYVPIPGYEKKYKISNHGNVLNIITNKILKPQLKYKNTNNEYYIVIINYNNKKSKIAIHKLMAKSFKLDGSGKYVIHIDNNNKNNNIENLKLSNNKHYNFTPSIKKYVIDTSTFKPIGYINNVYYNYKINPDGIIINKNNIRLTSIKCSDGYEYIRLFNNGTYIKVRIDKLIGKVFLVNGDKYFNDKNYIIKYNIIGDRKDYYWYKK